MSRQEDSGCSLACDAAPMGCVECLRSGGGWQDDYLDDDYEVRIYDPFDNDKMDEIDELHEMADDIEAYLDGGLMSLGELAAYLRKNRKFLNRAYAVESMMPFIGFGFNEGDDMFTVNVDWRD